MMSFNTHRSCPLRFPSPRRKQISPGPIATTRCKKYLPLSAQASTTVPTRICREGTTTTLSRPPSRNGRMLSPLTGNVTARPAASWRRTSAKKTSSGSTIAGCPALSSILFIGWQSGGYSFMAQFRSCRIGTTPQPIDRDSGDNGFNHILTYFA